MADPFIFKVQNYNSVMALWEAAWDCSYMYTFFFKATPAAYGSSQARD